MVKKQMAALVVYDPRGSVDNYFNEPYFVQNKLLPLLKARYTSVIEKKITSLSGWNSISVLANMPNIVDVYVLFHANPFKTLTEPGTIPRKYYYDVLKRIEATGVNLKYPNSSSLNELVSFKSYTPELARRGVPMLPTLQLASLDVKEVTEHFQNIPRVIIKLGGSSHSRHCYIVPNTGPDLSRTKKILSQDRDLAQPLVLLIQPYVTFTEEVRVHFIFGEYYRWWSTYPKVMKNGTIRHGVRKKSKSIEVLGGRERFCSVLDRIITISKKTILPYLQEYQQTPIPHFRTDWFLMQDGSFLLNEVEVWSADIRTDIPGSITKIAEAFLQ